MKTANAYSADCPTRQILDRVGDKWAVLILLLLRKNPCASIALRRAIEGISQKMLSQVLKSLERDGLIRRRAIATVPVTVEYSITPLGQTLAAAVDPLRDWAERNLKEVLAAQRRYDAQRKELVAWLNLTDFPALASSTSTRNSISDNTASRPGSPEEDLRLAAASRSRFTVEASRLPESRPSLRSSSTSSAPLPRRTERLRRSTGSSSTPCSAISASILAVAFGAAAARASWADAGSGSEKPLEEVRLALVAGVPSVVPFGP